MYMRAFAEAWPDAEIVQQAVGQLPWGHNLALLTRLKNPAMCLTYAQRYIHQAALFLAEQTLHRVVEEQHSRGW